MAGTKNLAGGKAKEDHVLEESNLERAENRRARDERVKNGIQKFPMHVHKPDGLVREVKNEDELADAKAKGWFERLQDVPRPEVDTDATLVSQMTEKQAIAFVKKAAASELSAIEADESAHGNRAAVIAAINEAKDGAGPKKTAAKPAAKKK